MNRGFVYSGLVSDRLDGATVLDYLVREYPHSDRETWCRRIEAGRVRQNDTPVTADDRVRAGDTVTWHRPPWTEPSAPTTFTVIHRDRHLVVVDKPAGLPTLPGGGFLENTLLHRVRQTFPEATPVHRLGRWTSGLVVLAWDASVREALTRAWADRRVDKDYLALLSGVPDRDRFTVDHPIGPVPYAPLGTVHAADPEGKPSHSKFTVLERRADTSVARVRIATGRPHQIRIHAAVAGHPLHGDPLYRAGGIPAPDGTAVPGDPGYQLHAVRLSFLHPGTQQPFAVESPAPGWAT